MADNNNKSGESLLKSSPVKVLQGADRVTIGVYELCREKLEKLQEKGYSKEVCWIYSRS